MEKEEDEEVRVAERTVTSMASSLGLGKAVALILPQGLEWWKIPFLCEEAPLLQRQNSNEL